MTHHEEKKEMKDEKAAKVEPIKPGDKRAARRKGFWTLASRSVSNLLHSLMFVVATQKTQRIYNVTGIYN